MLAKACGEEQGGRTRMGSEREASEGKRKREREGRCWRWQSRFDPPRWGRTERGGPLVPSTRVGKPWPLAHRLAHTRKRPHSPLIRAPESIQTPFSIPRPYTDNQSPPYPNTIVLPRRCY